MGVWLRSKPVMYSSGLQALVSASRRAGREPLLHFFVIGTLLFFAGQAWRDRHDAHRIVVTPGRVSELSDKYRLQFAAPPSEAELATLVLGFVRQEALYREGKALGLDGQDEVIRRRVAQKVEFLSQDQALPAEPGEPQLRAWFESHEADYATPPRTSFRHLYFSPDTPGDPQRRAAAALGALRGGASESGVGADPFSDQGSYARLSAVEAARLFGSTPLAQNLDTAPRHAWSGPYRSGYGWHLVFVEVREAGRVRAFAEARPEVREAYLADARRKANAASIDRIVARYRVVIEGGR